MTLRLLPSDPHFVILVGVIVFGVVLAIVSG
jgi:hypothetical protein